MIPVDRIPIAHILELTAFIAPVQAALGLQDKAVPPALQGLTQYGFTVADAVDRGCINVVDAQLISVIQQVLHHLHVHRHIRPDVAGPEAPCPKGYLRHFDIGITQFLIFHIISPNSLQAHPQNRFGILRGKRDPGIAQPALPVRVDCHFGKMLIGNAQFAQGHGQAGLGKQLFQGFNAL